MGSQTSVAIIHTALGWPVLHRSRNLPQLADEGSTDTLDVRRSQALGLLARGQLNPTRPLREMVLYVHTTHDNLTTQGGLATIENAGGHLITINQVRTWRETPGTGGWLGKAGVVARGAERPASSAARRPPTTAGGSETTVRATR